MTKAIPYTMMKIMPALWNIKKTRAKLPLIIQIYSYKAAIENRLCNRSNCFDSYTMHNRPLCKTW